MANSLRELARKAYYRLTPTPEYEGTTLDEAFPGVSKTVLRESEQIPVPEMRSMQFPPGMNHLPHLRGTYRTPTIFTACLDDVLFCPYNNVVLTRDDEVVAETVGPGARAQDVDDYQIRKNKGRVEQINGYCTALRSRYTSFSHFLLDELPRFNFLNHNYFRQFDEIKILCPGGLRTSTGTVVQAHKMTDETFFLDRLSPPNVTFVPLEEDRLYSVDKYLFVSFGTRRGSWYLPDSYVENFKSKICRSVDSCVPRNRIYVSRSKAPRRRVLNEDELTSELEKLGFETYHTEEYSPEDQIRIFKNAEAVVMPHGSGIANLLYADHTRVLVFHSTSYVQPHNYFLCRSLGHEHEYLCEGDGKLNDDFEVNVDRVIESLPSRRTNSNPHRRKVPHA